MKTILNLKTDKELKLAAQETAKELGIPFSTAINAFLKQFVRDRELTLSASYKPSQYLEQVISESEKEYEEGKSHGPFNSADEMFKSLNI